MATASAWRDWGKSIGQSIVATILISLVPGGIVAYLAHVQSVWTRPTLEGLGATVMICIVWVGIMAVSHLPPRRIQPNARNIESCIRTWLDNYKVTLKNDPGGNTYFRLRITLDSGVNMTVLRSQNEYTEYVQLIADLGIRGDDKKLLEQFSESEISKIILDIRFELARAGMGYGGLVNPPESFHVFKRIPIHHNLSEFVFMSFVGEMEAAIHLVGLTYLKARMEREERTEKTLSPTTRKLLSGNPKHHNAKSE